MEASGLAPEPYPPERLDLQEQPSKRAQGFWGSPHGRY